MLNTDRLCLGCMNDNGGEKICSICGYDSSVDNDNNHLPSKIWLCDRFLIGKAIFQNGEGITYIGWDNQSDSIVNIKEYFPTGAALRNPDKTVSIVSGKEYDFNEGLMSFLEINKLLPTLSLPSLYETITTFEENGSAYTITAGISGIHLRDFLVRNGGNLTWEQTKPLIIPLLETIKGLNDAGIIHGAVSPETIIVGRDGKLRLTGICIPTVRKAESGLESQLYPGFAAAEQYGFINLSIDKKCDVYGLCATLFRILIGTAPTPSNIRIESDDMSIPAKFTEEIPRHVLVSLANGLQVLPENRTPSIDIIKTEMLYIEPTSSTRKNSNDNYLKNSSNNSNKKSSKKNKSGTGKYILLSALITAVVFVLIGALLATTVFKDTFFRKNNSSVSSQEVSAPSVASIGSVDSKAAAEDVKTFTVPDLKGKYYSQLIDNEEFKMYQFTIKDTKQYSNTYTKGQIISQNVAAGTQVERNATIEIVISLGSSELKIANVLSLDVTNAKLELLKQGFLYENIEVVDKYDSSAKPGIVLEQEPKQGTKVNPEIPIKIYVNTYEGDGESSLSSANNSSGRTVR